MDKETQSEHQFASAFTTFSRITGVAVILLGVVVIFGWILDIRLLKSIYVGWSPMQPITAVSFVLLGFALLSLHMPDKDIRSQLSTLLSLAVVLIGIVTICEYAFAWNPGVDHLLFRSSIQGESILMPGRMAPNTALGFLLLGISMMLARWRPRISLTFASIAVLIGVTALLGYAYAESVLRGIYPFTQMSLHTAIGIMLLSLGIVFACPESDFFSTTTSDGPSGVIMRRLLPSLVIVTLITGWLVLWGERSGLYNGPFGMSIFVVMMVAILVVLVTRSSMDLHRSHVKLKAATARIQEMLEIAQEQTEELRSQGEELAAANEELACINEELEQTNEYLHETREEADRKSAQIQAFLSSMMDGITMFSVDGSVVFMNEAGKEIIGVPKDTLPSDWRNQIQWFTLDGLPLPVEQTASHMALNGEPVREMRVKLIGPTGKSAILSVSSSPVKDLQGQVVGAVNVFRDIGEQVDFEKRQDELFKREHNIAQALQQALVPQVAFEIPGCSVVTRYEPALKEAEVGGDFYDVFEIDEGKVGIVIGDVVGKGLPAAMRVAAARYAIRSYSYLDPSPARVMTMANQALCRDQLDSGKMLTSFFAVVDLQEQSITYTTAGHEPPVLLTRDGGAKELGGTGCALGILDYCTYSESEHPFCAGDVLLLMTDGITEARTSGSNLFGKERVMDYINANVGSSLDELASGLLVAAKEYAGGVLRDDAAVLLFRMAGDSLGVLEDMTISIRCHDDLAECRCVTDDFARRSGFERQETWNIVSSVFEACVNALIHGFDESGGTATLNLRRYHDRIEAVIRDSGKGFTVPGSSAIPPPTSPRGRGIPLMRFFMDEVRFHSGNGCMVTLVKRINSDPALEGRSAGAVTRES